MRRESRRKLFQSSQRPKGAALGFQNSPASQIGSRVKPFPAQRQVAAISRRAHRTLKISQGAICLDVACDGGSRLETHFQSSDEKSF